MRRFHVRFAPEYIGYTFDFFEEHQDGKVYRPLSIQLEPEPHQIGKLYNPLMLLENTEAQQLIQTLWDAGLRPNNGEGTSAQIESIKYHLEDMRKLAFRKR